MIKFFHIFNTMIMHTKHKLKSMLLIIGIAFSLITISNINKIFAKEPEIIAIIYVSENCSKCDSIINTINSMIPDSMYLDERNISESAKADEYNLIKNEYKISSNSLPLLVTQNGVFTTETQITKEIEDLVDLLETAQKDDPDSEIITEKDVKETTDETTKEINKPEEKEKEVLQTTIPTETVKTEASLLLTIFSFTIPAFMIWATFFIIKKLKL